MIIDILNQILSARYGRDVRQAIHDGIQQCYNDGKAGSIDLEARQGIQTLESEIAELQKFEVITETTSTTQPNSYAGRENILEIGGGESEQDSTAGNQLWNADSLIGVASKEYDSFFEIATLTEGTYTIYIEYAGGTAGSTVYFYGDGGTTIKSVTSGTAKMNVTFTAEEASKILTATIFPYNANVGKAYKTVMFNKGDAVLSQEKYTGGQPAPNPSYSMEIKKSVVSGVKTHGRQLLDLRNGNGGTKEGVTFANNGDGSYALTGTATGDSGNMWFLGGYNRTPASDDSNVILTLYKGRSYYISDCNIFTVLNGKSASYKGLVVPTYDIKVTGVRNPALTNGKTYSENIYPMVIEGDSLLPWEAYTEKTITFSKPIDLYGKDGVQDIITAKPIKRRFAKRVFNGSESWSTSATLTGRFIVAGLGCKSSGKVLCTQAKSGLAFNTTTINECYLSGNSNGQLVINTEFATVDEWKAHLASNPMEVVYELAEETTEDLPIADQIGLNSLATYDGITYVEFIYEGPQPTFKGEYGTSKVGGYTLESLLVARNNDLRISALEA